MIPRRPRQWTRIEFTLAMALGLEFGAIGCALVRSAAKDPVAAVAKVKDDARIVRAETAKACADMHAAESAGLVPAGKVRDDLDLFCELDAATR